MTLSGAALNSSALAPVLLEEGRCLMPRIANSAPARAGRAPANRAPAGPGKNTVPNSVAKVEDATSARVDDLIQRGRSQGHLSLSDLRTAFQQAGLTPTEARSILRELSEAGVRLANEEP